MKIYLDACCLGRLTDDQSQPRIRLEALAVEEIFSRIFRKTDELVSSEALEAEVLRNPSPERRAAAEILLSLATTRIAIDAGVIARARSLVSSGYGPFDALHLASAESAGADVLLTTDDRFLKRALRHVGGPRIPVASPLSWNQEPVA